MMLVVRKFLFAAFTIVLVGLLAACQLPVSKEVASVQGSSESLPNEFSISSADWVDPKQEDAIASTVKVTRVTPDIYKMVFTIDYAALDKGIFGYDGSNMGYFVNCVTSHILNQSYEPSYLFMGRGKDEPNGDGMLPKSPFAIYLGLSKTSQLPDSSNQSIIWDGQDGSDSQSLKNNMNLMCKKVFKRYPK